MMDVQSQQITGSKKIIDKKYIIETSKIVGSGSYSNVYYAYPINNPSVHLACKVINKKQLEQHILKKNCTIEEKKKLKQYIVKRIQSQIDISTKIKHPNIVNFIAFSETQNNIYIFMERCDSNLEYYIKQTGPIPQKKAISFFKDLVDAACLLYDCNVTHRDIKPQNILISDGKVKLADFGFAKIMKAKDVQQDGTVVGTVLFMAPQLIFQQKPQYSIRCDVWSIGVVIYYVLYGNMPWSTEQTLESFQMCLRKPLDFSNNIELSNKMKNVISKMLIFKDEQRINIKQVKAQIDELIDFYSS